MKYKLINEINDNFSPTQQILTNRGIDSKDIENYLKTKDSDILSSLLLDNIKEGAVMLISHIKNKSKILIQIDSDCDGYTSSAELLNYLFEVFPSSINRIDYRIHDGKEHGVDVNSVIEGKYDLVIIPDAGSNQFEEHKILKENGIDVLVIDHHETEKYSSDAIVINNQLSSKYTNKSLSGVGIVYKFLKCIDQAINIELADKYLDLVALGGIADMMDMRNKETKHLFNKGISNIRNPFFKALIERQSYSIGESITPIGIAFYIAPLINATIRVGTQEEKITMFKAMVEHLAYEKVPSTKRGHKGEMETVLEQAVRNATNIRNRQKRDRDQGIEYVESIIQQNNLNDNKIILIQVGDSLNKNLTGLIANQLMAKYQKPILLLRETEDGLYQGSARGYDKSELKDFKDFLTQSELMEYAEGHAQAFGAGIMENNIPSLIQYSNSKLNDFDFSSSYDVDFIYQANDFKNQDIIEIAGMKSLWGKGVDEALVAIENVSVHQNNLTLMSPNKNPTIKISLPNGTSLIKFGASVEEYNELKTNGAIKLNVIGSCEINEWAGNITPQIFVKDYEITSKQEFYF